MAIITLPFYAIVLRPFVKQDISASGLKYLLGYSEFGRNFDGEIMVFGAMNPTDHHNYMERLISFGYKGPDNGDNSDIAQGQMHSLDNCPSWLETVNVKFFDESLDPVSAWKMKTSNVYELIDFHDGKKVPTKGYECDWPPHIGKIS